MIPFVTLREVFRVPWVRENREAVHILSNMFYLLVALYRSRRFRDFCCLHGIFFMMIESFALYDRKQSKEALDRLLRIPWFQERQRDLYRSIATYNRVIKTMQDNKHCGDSADRQEELNKQVKEFVIMFKSLTQFNEKDEARVNALLAEPGFMDESLSRIFRLLG